ncbi:MAG: LptA/OstA family protein [Pseudomonadota bacterium]
MLKFKNRSNIVKLTKYTLVFIVLLTTTIVFYYIFLNQNNNISHKTTHVESEKQVNEVEFRANNPDLIGVSVDHGPYYIQANEMEEISGRVYFIDPKVRLMLKHLDWLSLRANKAYLTTKNNHLELFDDINSDLNKEYFFKGNYAEIFAQDYVIKSDQDSLFFTKEYNLSSAKGFIVNYNEQKAFFHGDIIANIQREKDKSRINIESEKLDVFFQNKEAHFIGKVVLDKDGTKVYADKMVAFVNPKTDQIEKIYAYDNVKIINDKQTATGDFGEYIVATSILTLKNNVKLKKQRDVAEGELLHYNFKTKKADLVGTNTNKRVRVILKPKQ